MIRYISKRILIMIPVLLGISFLIFSIMSLTPGDPALNILGKDATPESLQLLREEMGLNENFLTRYAKYMINAFRGNFGISYTTKTPVFDEVFTRYPTTLKLSFFSVLFAVTLGIPIGIVSAIKRYSLADSFSMTGALLLTSIPSFWLGLMLMLQLSLKHGWLPSTGFDSWKHYIMPCITLGAADLAILLRITRSNMLEVIRQDYIRTAKAKGAGEVRLIFKHAFRNAMLPIVTTIGLTFGSMLSGAIVVESVFGIPGVGTMIINAIRAKDTPLVMASVLFFTVIIGLINLLVDILYAFIDPRVASRYRG